LLFRVAFFTNTLYGRDPKIFQVPLLPSSLQAQYLLLGERSRNFSKSHTSLHLRPLPYERAQNGKRDEKEKRKREEKKRNGKEREKENDSENYVAVQCWPPTAVILVHYMPFLSFLGVILSFFAGGPVH
jgi:hypothetical protein